MMCDMVQWTNPKISHSRPPHGASLIGLAEGRSCSNTPWRTSTPPLTLPPHATPGAHARGEVERTNLASPGMEAIRGGHVPRGRGGAALCPQAGEGGEEGR